mgnify:CR=1 FL=1
MGAGVAPATTARTRQVTPRFPPQVLAQFEVRGGVLQELLQESERSSQAVIPYVHTHIYAGRMSP